MEAGDLPPGGAGGAPRETAAPDRQAPDLQALARDWITLWQSELAAAAADRELAEGWQQLAALWAGAAAATLQAWPRGAADGAPGGAGTGVTPRPATAAAAPDPRDAEIERLARRIAELERRLAELETRRGEAAAALAAALAERAGAFPRAILEETLRQDRALIAGIAAYRRHPWIAVTFPTRRRSWPRATRGCSISAAPGGRCCSCRA